MNEVSDDKMFSLLKLIWIQDPILALRNLLSYDYFITAFVEFLKTELAEDMFSFVLDVRNLEGLSTQARSKEAIKMYKIVMQATRRVTNPKDSSHIPNFKQDNLLENEVDPKLALKKIHEEAEITFKMLASDSFPRFLESSFSTKVIEMLQHEKILHHESFQCLNDLVVKSYVDAESWLQQFCEASDKFPACIVIADVTLPGAPLVFVNEEFCKVTGYSKEEIHGRNCSFLQGPDTEPDPIFTIRRALSKANNCRVSITNYRKSGEKFKNLLSLKPVFDGGDIYRFVIGVQLDIFEDALLLQRLNCLDALLCTLPRKLEASSISFKKSGKSRKLKKSRFLDKSNSSDYEKGMWEHMTASTERLLANNIGVCNTIYSFTKIIWLNTPMDAMKAIVGDPIGREMFSLFCSITSTVYQAHFEFCCQFDDIAKSQVNNK